MVVAAPMSINAQASWQTGQSQAAGLAGRDKGGDRAHPFYYSARCRPRAVP